MDSKIPKPSNGKKPVAGLFDFNSVKDKSAESEQQQPIAKKPLTGELNILCKDAVETLKSPLFVFQKSIPKCSRASSSQQPEPEEQTRQTLGGASLLFSLAFAEASRP